MKNNTISGIRKKNVINSKKSDNEYNEYFDLINDQTQNELQNQMGNPMQNQMGNPMMQNQMDNSMMYNPMSNPMMQNRMGNHMMQNQMGNPMIQNQMGNPMMYNPMMYQQMNNSMQQHPSMNYHSMSFNNQSNEFPSTYNIPSIGNIDNADGLADIMGNSIPFHSQGINNMKGGGDKNNFQDEHNYREFIEYSKIIENNI